MGRPMRLAPSDAVSEPALVLRLRDELPRVAESGFAAGRGGGAIELRMVFVERWLRDRGPSRESVEDPRLIRAPAGKTGTLVRLSALTVLESPEALKKSGELGRDVVGVGIEVRPLVNERLGPGILKLFGMGESSPETEGVLTGNAVGGGLLLPRRGTTLRGGGESSITRTQPGLSGATGFLAAILGELPGSEPWSNVPLRSRGTLECNFCSRLRTLARISLTICTPFDLEALVLVADARGAVGARGARPGSDAGFLLGEARKEFERL